MWVSCDPVWGVGWKYEVSDPIDRKWTLGTKKYAFNFLAENVERKLRKEGPRTKEYVQPTALGTYHITCRWREGNVDETLRASLLQADRPD